MSKSFTHVIVRNKIANFDKWYEGFVGHGSSRREAGISFETVFRNIAAPEECFVLLTTNNELATKEFLESKNLKEYKESLGVVAAPEYSYVKQAEASHTVLAKVQEAFLLIDQKNAAAFGRLFTSDGKFTFGSQAPVVGPKGVELFCESFFSNLESIGHERICSFENHDKAQVVGRVHYTFRNGKKLAIDFSNFFEVNEAGQFKNWQIFIDPAPIFKAMS